MYAFYLHERGLINLKAGDLGINSSPHIGRNGQTTSLRKEWCCFVICLIRRWSPLLTLC